MNLSDKTLSSMMSEVTYSKQNKDRNEMFLFVPSGICIFLIMVSWYISGMAPVKKGELLDTDCYMHLVRVRDLYCTGNWHDPVVIRANAPYGHRLHWSKPFDILLLIGAVPVSLFVDFETALFWWGVVVSPILMIASFIVIPWATRPVFTGKDGPFLAGFVFIFQSSVLALCQAGRPDHHSLLLFIFVLSVGINLRLIQNPYKALLCYTAGAVSGLAMWVSLESIVPTCIIIGVLGLLWILRNDNFSTKSLHYCVALLVIIGLSIFIEKPWNAMTRPEYDRTSIVHWSIFGFITIFWTTIFIFDRYTSLFQWVTCRFWFAIIGVVVIVLATILCFPNFYNSPYPEMDAKVFKTYFTKVNEIQPLLSSDSLPIAIQLIGSAIVCFPFLVYLIFRKKRDNDRQAWIYILLSFIIFLLASLYQVQWSGYAQTLLVLPMTRLMVLLRQRGPKTGFLKTVKNDVIILMFCGFPLFFGLFVGKFVKKESSTENHQSISIVRLCEYLNTEGKRQERNFRILAHIDFGPEILYRTQHEVIATPYHTRNGLGILDTYNIMTADTDEQALEIIRKRSIDMILLCPESSELAVYSKPGHESTFYKRLLAGSIPDWLRKVELPSDLSSSFILFETIKPFPYSNNINEEKR